MIKLAYTARDESIRVRSREAARERDLLFRDVILLLEKNLYESPSTGSEKKHNLIDYEKLASAFLGMGDHRTRMRSQLDESAVYWIAQGLRIDPDDKDMWYALNHPGASKALARKGIDTTRATRREIVKLILGHEKEFYESRESVDSFLRDLSSVGSYGKWSPSSKGGPNHPH
jgi:hypothetical protein